MRNFYLAEDKHVSKFEYHSFYSRYFYSLWILRMSYDIKPVPQKWKNRSARYCCCTIHKYAYFHKLISYLFQYTCGVMIMSNITTKQSLKITFYKYKLHKLKYYIIRIANKMYNLHINSSFTQKSNFNMKIYPKHRYLICTVI